MTMNVAKLHQPEVQPGGIYEQVETDAHKASQWATY